MDQSEVEALVLTTEAGRALLVEVAAVARPGRRTWPGGGSGRSGEWVAAAIRLVEGRRKGAAKFDRADRMWFDPVGVEQATAEAVARHKARRFGEGGAGRRPLLGDRRRLAGPGGLGPGDRR